jgi:ribonuclease HI
MGVALHNGLRSLRRLMEDLNEPERYTAYSRVLGAYVDTLLDRELSPLVPCPAESENANEFFLLFFDGGSRGNPGPGASGAVVVRVQADSHAAEIQWVASMSYGHPSTTNNTAEYWGLVHGLRHAQEARLQPLHVVGDSAIIISQQRTHRPPKKKHLLQLYHKARRIADVIGVKSWTHHYRAFNKMADHAANAAMDSRTSQQAAATHPREIISTVAQFLDNDVLHWLTERPGGIMQLRPHENPEPDQSQQLQHYIESFARTAPSVR